MSGRLILLPPAHRIVIMREDDPAANYPGIRLPADPAAPVELVPAQPPSSSPSAPAPAPEGLGAAPREALPFAYPVTSVIGDARNTPWAQVHTGVDFAMPCGTPVAAMRPGVVVREGLATDGITGIFVYIKYTDDIYAIWAHMAETYVSAGDVVDYTTIIGRTGNTGSPGLNCHLHLELHDVPGYIGQLIGIVNPIYYFSEYANQIHYA